MQSSLRETKILGAEVTDGADIAKVTNGGLDINIQDQHTRAMALKFSQAAGAPTTLSVAAAIDDQSITVVDPALFTPGLLVGIFDNAGNFYFGEAISNGVNPVVLDTPIDAVFAIGSNVIASSTHLNVNGSVTPQTFAIGSSGSSITVDITRIMGVISTSASMDDGKFGGLDPLANGCVLRHVNGRNLNLWNVKTNGDIALICFDATYSTKSPAGENGFRFRNTFAGQSKHGVTLRLEPGDTLELIVQDDITGNTDFQMMAQGHEVE